MKKKILLLKYDIVLTWFDSITELEVVKLDQFDDMGRLLLILAYAIPFLVPVQTVSLITIV